MKTLITILALLFSQSALAGDASFFSSLGFSQDGKYFAFTEEGVYDGLGAYWIELGIIEVDQNKYVGRLHIGGESDEGDITTEDHRDLYLRTLKQKLSFESYGFSKKVRQETLIKREQKDLSHYTNTLFSIDYWATGGASSQFPTFKLILDEIPAPINADNEWCEDWMGDSNSMIELRLVANPNNGENGFVNELQIDKKQPKVRSCAYNYSIREVHYYKGKIAVVIRYQSPGFEGPNERNMIVTGLL